MCHCSPLQSLQFGFYNAPTYASGLAACTSSKHAHTCATHCSPLQSLQFGFYNAPTYASGLAACTSSKHAHTCATACTSSKHAHTCATHCSPLQLEALRSPVNAEAGEEDGREDSDGEDGLEGDRGAGPSSGIPPQRARKQQSKPWALKLTK